MGGERADLLLAVVLAISDYTIADAVIPALAEDLDLSVTELGPAYSACGCHRRSATLPNSVRHHVSAIHGNLRGKRNAFATEVPEPRLEGDHRDRDR
jgi:hypothetical protein